MGKNMYEDLIVGLDLGTTKICAVIAEVLADEQVNIIGVGIKPSKGLRKGVVVNIETTIESVKAAVAEAERMAGVSVGSVFTGIAGGHIKGLNSHGVIAVSRKDKEIHQEDVDRVIDAAKAIALPLDREVIHVIPQEFIIDNQDGIKEPIGMSGVRLEAEVHMVTGAVTSVQNIIKSVERAGYAVEDIVLQPLASAEAVLSPDEKELGIVLVDIGGGTTDIAIFVDGSLWHSSVLAIGGNMLTSDIAIGMRTPNHDAEQIKREYGCAMVSMINEGQEITVPGVGGREPRIMPRRDLAEIIQPRMEEIFELVDMEIKKNGFEEKAAAGVVLTGGSSLLEGTEVLAEEILQVPVRIGAPKNVTGMIDVITSPKYSTAVGLVCFGAKSRPAGKPARFTTERNLFNRTMERMKEWFSDYF
ncbi:cell division protein FtsA [bacterium]|nr:cell division protein FtsA [bacterium]